MKELQQALDTIDAWLLGETWKPIPAYEGLYEVSDKGRVRNRHGKIKSPFENQALVNVYLRVRLYRNGEGRNYYIHRLVAMAFHEKKPGARFVHHKDRDTFNNHKDNVTFVTPSENSQAIHEDPAF